MGSRLELHEELCTLLGSRNVYFQPPESVKLSYPAIVYSLDDIYSNHANNLIYKFTKRYMATVISTDPDSTVVDSMLTLPMCSFNRYYTRNNLNHWVFTLYF